MGAVTAFSRRVADGLANLMTGAGTTADKRAHAFYHLRLLDQQQAEAAYRSSWLVRKIVDLPPEDMTREWRDWQAEADQIEEIEAEEARLGLPEKTCRALVLSRLHGGGALILGAPGEPGEELKPDGVGKGGLAYIHVVSRYELTIGQKRLDPADPWRGMPQFFELRGAGSARVQLHPSRVVPFVGQPLPEGAITGDMHGGWFWGDPLLQSIEDAVKNADMAQNGFASLIDEASVDVLKIPDLMANVGTAEYEQRFLRRLELAATGKSTHRKLVIDGNEDWEQRQVNWAGMPEIVHTYLNIVAGAADIPVTRLLGQSPKGLQSNGQGEERDYVYMIMAKQGRILRPAFRLLDEVLIRSALGSRPPEIHYTFAPLLQADPKELAEIEKLVADVADILARTNLVQPEALAKVVVNRMIESGQWPGIEEAVEEAKKLAGRVPDPANDDELDEDDDPSAIRPTARRRAANDAAPRTLYVSRKVENASEIIAWAKEQGFETTQPADALHVTIAFSRTPIDWMKVDPAWGDEKGRLTIAPGGPRVVEPLGPKGAVVLFFNSWELSYRHGRIRDAGASWDWPEYQPHITITYEPGDLDLSKVVPYRGRIVLGPEIFEEVVDDWEKGVKES